MTKLEALAKDCIENHTHKLIDRPSKQDIYTREESIYISGYKECERQNKNKITELEQKLEQTEKDLTDYQFNYPKIKDLEKENALLKGRNKGFEQQIMGLLIKYEEVYKRFPDLKSAMDKAQIILKENAELKKVNAETLSQLNLDNGELIIENEKLRKENAELKEHIKADCIDCADYIKNQKLEKENAELKIKNKNADSLNNKLEEDKFYVHKNGGHYYTENRIPVSGKLLFEGTEKECIEFVRKEMAKPYDYRSVVYAIEHILFVFEKDISPNLHNKLIHWKKNIQEELDKE